VQRVNVSLEVVLAAEALTASVDAAYEGIEGISEME
jgi:hypothetical protein